MHPFYGPSARLLGERSQVAGLVSMAAYLAFWAGAVAIGLRMVRDRLPTGAGPAPGGSGPTPGDAVPTPGGDPGRGPASTVWSARPMDPALAVLRERYARGELDRAQFLLIRADLSASPDPGRPEPWPGAPTPARPGGS